MRRGNSVVSALTIFAPLQKSGLNIIPKCLATLSEYLNQTLQSLSCRSLLPDAASHSRLYCASIRASVFVFIVLLLCLAAVSYFVAL